jgi:hypothetical protein
MLRAVKFRRAVGAFPGMVALALAIASCGGDDVGPPKAAPHAIEHGATCAELMKSVDSANPNNGGIGMSSQGDEIMCTLVLRPGSEIVRRLSIDASACHAEGLVTLPLKKSDGGWVVDDQALAAAETNGCLSHL